MSQTATIAKAIKARPITFMGLLCLLPAAVFEYSDPSNGSAGASLAATVSFTPYALVALGIGVLALLFFLPSFSAGNSRRLLIVIGAMGFGGLLFLLPAHPALTVLIAGILVLVAWAMYWGCTKRLTVKRVVLLLMAAGFLLRLCYVLYTPVSVRQHDVWYFSDGNFTHFTYQRHAEYIEYIATYLRLPSVDPTGVGLSQLYHPPFHHLLAGLWLRLNTAFGMEYTTACENIQLLTLFYSSACMVIVYRLFRLLKLPDAGLLPVMAIICFHPTFIIMAGSVNNDLLSVTLALYALYAAVRWFQTPSPYHILTVALGVGLSMMTKLSGGLVAPGIALLFLWKWVESYKKKDGSFQRLFGQFVLFAAVCIPLGLWWPVKNALAYHIPITYVPALSENSGQYLGEYSVAQRLFALPKESLSRIFMAWKNNTYHSSYNEYNCLLSLLKTSVFGEFTLFQADANPGNTLHAVGTGVCTVLFYSNLALVGLSVYAGVRCLLRRQPKAPAVSLCLLLIWAVVFGSYIQFCFTYPQACTQNFRYAVPTLVCGCIALGAHCSRSSRGFRRVTAVCTGVFCLSSLLCYSLLGLV